MNNELNQFAQAFYRGLGAEYLDKSVEDALEPIRVALTEAKEAEKIRQSRVKGAVAHLHAAFESAEDPTLTLTDLFARYHRLVERADDDAWAVAVEAWSELPKKEKEAHARPARPMPLTEASRVEAEQNLRDNVFDADTFVLDGPRGEVVRLRDAGGIPTGGKVKAPKQAARAPKSTKAVAADRPSKPAKKTAKTAKSGAPAGLTAKAEAIAAAVKASPGLGKADYCADALKGWSPSDWQNGSKAAKTAGLIRKVGDKRAATWVVGKNG